MLYGIIIRLKEMGIENAYINSYDWRKKVYNHCGFVTEDSIGYWRKKIRTRTTDFQKDQIKKPYADDAVPVKMP